jgi:hypothetical protein
VDGLSGSAVVEGVFGVWGGVEELEPCCCGASLAGVVVGVDSAVEGSDGTDTRTLFTLGPGHSLRTLFTAFDDLWP